MEAPFPLCPSGGGPQAVESWAGQSPRLPSGPGPPPGLLWRWWRLWAELSCQARLQAASVPGLALPHPPPFPPPRPQLIPPRPARGGRGPLPRPLAVPSPPGGVIPGRRPGLAGPLSRGRTKKVEEIPWRLLPALERPLLCPVVHCGVGGGKKQMADINTAMEARGAGLVPPAGSLSPSSSALTR